MRKALIILLAIFLSRRVSASVIPPYIDLFSPKAHSAIWNFIGGVYSSERSLNLGGTDECATAADAAAFNVGSNFSVAFWVKATTQASAKILFSQYDYGNNTMSWAVWSGPVASQKLEFIISDDGTYGALHTKDYFTSVNVLTSAWVHFVAVYAAGTITLYINGTADGSPTKVLDAAITGFYNSAARLGVGCDYNSGARADFFVGRIDQPTLYNVALSSGNVTSLYNSGVKVSPQTVSGAAASWEIKGSDTSTSIAEQIGGLSLTGHNLESGDIDTDI